MTKETKEEREARKKNKPKAQLGTHSMIKLPFVIGTREFEKHPFAGTVYMGDQDDFEQV